MKKKKNKKNKRRRRKKQTEEEELVISWILTSRQRYMVYPRINNTVLNCFKKTKTAFIYIKAKHKRLGHSCGKKRRKKTEEEE